MDADDADGVLDSDAGPPCMRTVGDGVDEPDPLGFDTDCDGVDGDAARSVFVSPSGVDPSSPDAIDAIDAIDALDAIDAIDPSVGTRRAPLRTIGAAIALARARGLGGVLVATGTYPERVALAPGIGIHGGYDPVTWARSLTWVSGSVGVAGRGQTLVYTRGPALSASAIDEPTRVSHITFRATDATGASESSYGARFFDSDGVVLEDVQLEAGRAGDGADAATPGRGALPIAAAEGGAGGNGPPGRFVTSVSTKPYLARFDLRALEYVPSLTTSILTACTDGLSYPSSMAYDCIAYTWSGSLGAGAAGTGTCPCTNGGDGGRALDPRIAIPAGATSPFRTARGGAGGAGATAASPSADDAGASSCVAPVPGAGGRAGSHDFVQSPTTSLYSLAPTADASLAPAAGVDGSPGAIGPNGAGAPAASFDASGFVASDGRAGANGGHGRGGYGGGGGYAAAALDPSYTAWITASGGGGGGGGAGGCGGVAGGAGGGGGASIGLLLVRSHPTLLRVFVQSRDAGRGGAGTPGQAGGGGGAGGLGGNAGVHPKNTDHIAWAAGLAIDGAVVPASAGGSGGRGGDGGAGGAGGGGAGGTSASIVLVSGSSMNTASRNVSMLAGAPGARGSGGLPDVPELTGAPGRASALITVP